MYRRAKSGSAIGFIVVCCAAGIGFAYFYVSQERVFHYWDLRFYHDLALQSWQNWRLSWSDWAGFLGHWLTQDYNANYTLPLPPWFEWIGAARADYIAALVAFYLLPCCLLVGLLGRELVADKPRAVFAVVAAATLLLPSHWRPTLGGFPGIGGSALLVAALLIYVRDERWRHWWTAPGFGLLLAAAILFRRHFGYAVVALYLAVLTVGGLAELAANGRWLQRLGGALRHALYLLLAGCVQLALMYALAPEFTVRAALTDYTVLYDSYRRPVLDNVNFIRSGFGDALLLLALLGFGLAAWQGWVARRHVALLLLFVISWLALWLLAARQVTTHVFLHALLPAVGIGLGFAGYGLWRVPLLRPAALVVGLAPALAFASVYIVRHPVMTQWTAALHPLLPVPLRPSQVHAADYALYLDLIRYVDGQAGDAAQVYVAASSEGFNGDLLISAGDTAFGAGQHRLRLLPVAHVDSRDFLPLEALLRADLVLVALPVQYSLPPAEQDVVRMAVAPFSEGWALAADFAALPRQFSFTAGFTVTLYRRLRPTSVGVAAATLTRMYAALDDGRLPGRQTDWMALSRSGASYSDGPGRLLARPGLEPAAAPAGLLYIHPVRPPLALRAGAALAGPESVCAGLELRALTVPTAGGDATVVGRRALRAGADPALRFEIPGVAAGAPVYVLLQVAATARAMPVSAAESCLVTVSDARLTNDLEN